MTDPASRTRRRAEPVRMGRWLPGAEEDDAIFYGTYVPDDPLLGPLFADMSADHPERVAAWLGEVFGGPAGYTDATAATRAWSVSTSTGRCQRSSARAGCSCCAAPPTDAGLPPDAEFRAAFVAYLEWGSRIARENSTPGAKPPANMPVPRWWWVCDAYPGARPLGAGAFGGRRGSAGAVALAR